MEPTITLECAADSQHLHELEHRLKGVHGVRVYFIAPADKTSPVLISLGLSGKGESAGLEVRRIAHILYDYLHSSERGPGQQAITLVTIEGERTNIALLASDEIRTIIGQAYAGQ